MRVLHGTYEIAGQGMVLAEGLRRIGVDARSFAYRVAWDGRVPDEVVDLDALSPLARQAAKRAAFARLAPQFDVFHFHFGTSFEWIPLPFDLPWLRMRDVPVLKRMGKKVVFHFHGCEVRDRKLMLRRHPRAATCAECRPFCKPVEQRFFLERARAHADRVFYSTLDLGESVPNGVHLPLAIDAARWEAAGDRVPPALASAAAPRDGVHGPVVIAHAPTQRLIKGTRHVEAAVEALKTRFPRLELRMIEGRPWAEMPDALAACDLLVDQLFMGWYGLLAIEGMAVGRPVVCFLRPDFAATAPDCPIVSATPESLAMALAPLVADPALRAEFGRRGRAYARAHHDAAVVARTLEAHYRALLEPGGAGGAAHGAEPGA